MAYDINATLERLEQGINEIDSARMQVQNTVLASNELQATVAGYVSSINKFVGEIKEWEKHLEGTHVESTKDVLDAQFSGRNDILANNCKISGCARSVTRGHTLFHGTLLFDVDLSVLAKALKPDPDK